MIIRARLHQSLRHRSVAEADLQYAAPAQGIKGNMLEKIWIEGEIPGIEFRQARCTVIGNAESARQTRAAQLVPELDICGVDASQVSAGSGPALRISAALS